MIELTAQMDPEAISKGTGDARVLEMASGHLFEFVPQWNILLGGRGSGTPVAAHRQQAQQ